MDKNQQKSPTKDKYCFGGAAFACFYSAHQLLDETVYSIPQIVAMSGFAFALPFIVLLLLDVLSEERHGKPLIPELAAGYVSAAAILGSNIGYVALFWHVHCAAGVIALIAILIATCMLLKFKVLIDSPQRES